LAIGANWPLHSQWCHKAKFIPNVLWEQWDPASAADLANPEIKQMPVIVVSRIVIYFPKIIQTKKVNA